MSDQETGKKQVESIELDPFLEAYEVATGTHLSVVEGGENPDFICLHRDGIPIGLELTKITRRRDIVYSERILGRKEHMSSDQALTEIFSRIEWKEQARKTRYTARVALSMLVLQLVDGSLDDLRYVLQGLQNQFGDHGFAEIWLADYSGQDAYNDIELLGLHPQSRWGYYQRVWPDRKPYG